MSRPASLPRLDELDDLTANDDSAGPSEADIDAAHAMTGWSAYDVWKARVLVPARQVSPPKGISEPDSAGYKTPRGNT